MQAVRVFDNRTRELDNPTIADRGDPSSPAGSRAPTVRLTPPLDERIIALVITTFQVR